MKDDVFEEIRTLKKLKEKLKKKFDDDSYAFEKENFEVKRVAYMIKC